MKLSTFNNIMAGVRTTGVVLAAGLFLVSCTKDDASTTATTPTTPTNPDTFKGPTYADNYTPIGGWENRLQWNLANVHDPSVIKDGEYFYMYQTDASYGNASFGHGHFHARRSRDLVTWEYIGSTMDNPPAWVKETMNTKRAAMGLPAIDNPKYGYWAPCIRKVGNKFRMYYSIVVDELITGTDANASWGERPYIGFMETSSLASNQWEDKGMVICSEPDGVVDYIRDGANDWKGYYKFNGIDPSVIITPQGEHWLIYGSWHTGIAAVQLNPETGKPYQLNNINDYGTRIAGRGNIATNRWQALEGAEIIYNESTGYYYLFMAYDELSVAYNTRVARSTNILGPYYGIDGRNVSEGAECWPMLTHPYKFNNHTGWVGISHCSVFQDPDKNNKWYFSSQGRLPENVPGINVSNAVMMGQVRELEWTADGWPVVAPERYAGVPDKEFTATDFVGYYELLNMNYAYRVQQTSSELVIKADGTVSGALTGTWRYDSATKSIYINNMQCKVFNAWDWEASPRKVTTTFSGLTPEGKPLWGKKKF